MAFTLTSSAFGDGDVIPTECTCDGANTPPPLAWSGAPGETESFALIMDDPDAPGGTFTHWLLYDLSPQTARFDASTATSAKTLRNDFGRAGYGGPCPPRGHGAHRYRFTLHALDVPSLAVRGRNRSALDKAIEGHSLAQATLTGRYERR